MNISKYIIYYPYVIAWSIKKLFNKKKTLDFYCGNIVDYICIKKVLQHYPEMRIVAKNRSIQKSLEEYGVKSILYPTYPDLVVMCRHSARKYPGKNITKIGLRHGPYHFKDFINPKYYNEFDSYLFTSPQEVEIAKGIGINNGEGVGYPKLDDAFDGSIKSSDLEALKEKIGINNSLPTIIFTATWNKTNYSAVNKWCSRLNELSGDYNIIVTLHEWTTPEVKSEIKNTKGIYYIEDKEILQYLMIADLLVGDISSIIAEFSALDKPMITFKITEGKRTTQEIIDMLDNMTYRIDTFEELKAIIPQALSDKGLKHRKERKHFNNIMFGRLDGKANLRVKEVIDNYIKGVK